MKNFFFFLSVILTNCAFCQDKSISREWRKWQESLNLAYPEEVDFKIQLEKPILMEGEPLLLKCFIINKTAKNITVVPPYDRITALMTFKLGFNVLTEQNSEYKYHIGFHADGISLPGDEKVIGPHDSLYINAILWPNNFYDWDKRQERAQRRLFPPGQYKLYGRLFLGVKFYPKPSRDLIMVSDTILFTVNAIAPDEQNLLVTIEPLISAFFYKLENILLIKDSLRQVILPSLLPVFDELRRRNSIMIPLIDFVSIKSSALIDTSNIDRIIADAKQFIVDHQGSILAEEMEFMLAEMLYRQEKKSATFVKEANRIIAKYPKNINIFVLKEWLELPYPPQFYKGRFLHQ